MLNFSLKNASNKFKYIIELAHHIKNGEDHKAYDYLRDVNDLGITLGKFNKPLVANLNGIISK